MDGSSIMVTGGAASMSPTSPVSSRHGGAPKRKRSTGLTALESSPGSFLDDDQGDDKKRQPGVKRACNECRQQKVSHGDTYPDRFVPASPEMPGERAIVPRGTQRLTHAMPF